MKTTININGYDYQPVKINQNEYEIMIDRYCFFNAINYNVSKGFKPEEFFVEPGYYTLIIEQDLSFDRQTMAKYYIVGMTAPDGTFSDDFDRSDRYALYGKKEGF